jgi:hypothetical protein
LGLPSAGGIACFAPGGIRAGLSLDVEIVSTWLPTRTLKKSLCLSTT